MVYETVLWVCTAGHPDIGRVGVEVNDEFFFVVDGAKQLLFPCASQDRQQVRLSLRQD